MLLQRNANNDLVHRHALVLRQRRVLYLHVCVAGARVALYTATVASLLNEYEEISTDLTTFKTALVRLG